MKTVFFFKSLYDHDLENQVTKIKHFLLHKMCKLGHNQYTGQFKGSKGEQSYLHVTHCLDLMCMSTKYHQNI